MSSLLGEREKIRALAAPIQTQEDHQEARREDQRIKKRKKKMQTKRKKNKRNLKHVLGNDIQ